MKVNIREINYILNSGFDKCINYKLGENEKEFVNMIVNAYYDRVYLGLLDHLTNDELRKNMYKELLDIIEYNSCFLYQHVEICINDIKNESNCENIVVTDILKLQSCKDIEW